MERKRLNVNLAQMEKRINFASRVNVVLSVCIWFIAAVYLFVWNADKVNDGSYLRCLFAVTYITCLLVQMSVTAITAVFMRFHK